MSPNPVTEPNEQYFHTGDTIDFGLVFRSLWRNKRMIILSALLGATLAFLSSLLIPNIYHSEALLGPKSSSTNELSKLASQYGGLASLAGINLTGLGGEEGERINLAIRVIQSRQFFKEFLYEKMLIDLMAFDTWEAETNAVTYKEDIYDEKSNQWVREIDFPYGVVPSFQEAFEIFNENHLEIIQDNDPGFVVLRVRHESPHVARDWLALIIESINDSMRSSDIAEAQESIEFLVAQRSETELVALDEIFAQLIEEQTKTILLAQVSEDYVFNVIDEPLAPELEAEPNRVLITLFGCFFSLFLTAIFQLGRTSKGKLTPSEQG